VKAAAEERLRMSLYKSPGQVPSYRSVHVIAHSSAQGVINTEYERIGALAAPKEDRAAVCQWYHALHIQEEALRQVLPQSAQHSLPDSFRSAANPLMAQVVSHSMLEL
jgi:hypothetical protein